MKKLMMVLVLCMVFALGCAHAEIIPPDEPGQQIGYSAAILCEELSMRAKPSSSSRVIKTLEFGDWPIVVGADTPAGPKKENGFVYCTLSDDENAPCGWINADYIMINPAIYVTDRQTAIYAWNDTKAPKVALLDKGIRLPILKEEDAWYLVSLRAAVGWIHK